MSRVTRVERAGWSVTLTLSCGHTMLIVTPPWKWAVGDMHACETCAHGCTAPPKASVPLDLGRHTLPPLSADLLSSSGLVERRRPAAERAIAGPLLFRTVDHPQANGRTPDAGELGYQVRLRLEDGRILILDMGGQSKARLESILLSWMCATAHLADPQEDR